MAAPLPSYSELVVHFTNAAASGARAAEIEQRDGDWFETGTSNSVKVGAIEKMSKSKGNFITLEGAIDTWGSDATRFACADAGDGILNANYDSIVADKAILSLTTELEWVQQILSGAKAKGMGSSNSAPVDDAFDLDEDRSGPGFAASIGALIHVSRIEENDPTDRQTRTLPHGPFERIGAWLRDNL